VRYDIRYAAGVEKDLRKLPRNILARVDAAILKLADNPRPSGCVKLKGTSNTYRVRIGDWRVIYDVDDAGRVVILLIVAHRSQVYRDL
jgi:mRNA interferase RelE/StbE